VKRRCQRLRWVKTKTKDCGSQDVGGGEMKLRHKIVLEARGKNSKKIGVPRSGPILRDKGNGKASL